MKKRGIALLLTGLMIAATPFSAYADREDAKLNVPYVSLGADLNANERATVLNLLGVTEDELKNYTVATVTNQDEHDYLDSYLDKSVIGTRALSSVLVEGKEEGNGINVTTKNITYCTSGMYENALATAGIKDADIIVAGQGAGSRRTRSYGRGDWRSGGQGGSGNEYSAFGGGPSGHCKTHGED